MHKLFVKLLYHHMYGFVHGVSFYLFKEVVVSIRISKTSLFRLYYHKYLIALILFEIMSQYNLFRIVFYMYKLGHIVNRLSILQ